eukprot:TRINITY_DN137_c0_g1_i2.p1 TRINITY_DN137_c0_g1~~TRINITY_DN137_c0_g1_i2.p1  ORF type:complete len:615 (-),score=105.60 TRINITY_DN137_c0_g1_i2:222-1952(-)
MNEAGKLQLSTNGVELPDLLDFIKDIVDVEELEDTRGIEIEDIVLPKAKVNQDFIEDLKKFMSPDQIADDQMQRIYHTYGQSHRDLWRSRKGIFTAAPDLIIYPNSTEQVELVMKAAVKHNVCLVPYGGGTNIVGGIEPTNCDERMAVTLDMRRMNRMIFIDKAAKIACFECGVLGPDLENALEREGYKMGHDPDSFEWSTLGGWLATCSSGMQSDKYGDIEDMCISLKIVTPNGTISTPPVPRNGAGLTLKHSFIGSEGAFGIITEAVMRIHKLPEVKEFHGLMFRDWEHGVEAIREIMEKNAKPAMIRLYDDEETRLSFKMKPKSNPFAHTMSALIKKYMESMKGWDLDNITLMIVGFEGERKNVAHQKKRVFALTRKHEGLWLGQGPGKKWYEKRYDMPLLRDFVLGHGMWVDVTESSTNWPNVISLWRETKQAIANAVSQLGCPIWVGCHISHSYTTGCCLYFHFASIQLEDGEDLEVYLAAKKAAMEAVIRCKGALSHHHGVGFEHVPFMKRYFGEGLKVMRILKQGLDPTNVCNPGKLIPPNPNNEDMDDPSHLYWKRGIDELAEGKAKL